MMNQPLSSFPWLAMTQRRTCGRALSSQIGVSRGQGPVCWARTHPAVLRPLTTRARAVRGIPAPRRAIQVDGQLALDLTGGQA